MAEFDIVFEKLAEVLTLDGEDGAITVKATVTSITSSELDEIEELRRFSAELQEPEPPSFTMT